MMKQVWLVAIACACGCGHDGAPPASGSAAAAGSADLTRAAQIIDALSRKDFHAVVATFSPDVAKGLPEPQLAAVWTKLEQQAGALSKCDAPVATSSDPVV